MAVGEPWLRIYIPSAHFPFPGLNMRLLNQCARLRIVSPRLRLRMRSMGDDGEDGR